MAAISSTASTQAAIQGAMQQLRVQQAKQNAERAEQTAQVLARQAAAAEKEAVRANDNARSLTVQSGRAQTVAGQARQGLAMLSSVSDMQVQLGNTASQVVERSAVDQTLSEPASEASSTPVVNTSGQLTGVVVNVTA